MNNAAVDWATAFRVRWMWQLLLLGGWLGSATAHAYGDPVWVCNKGDVELRYVAFATNDSLWSGETAKVIAWRTIERDDCEDVGLSGYESVAVGFLQTDDQQVVGNPVYTPERVTESGSVEWSPAFLCAPVNGSRLGDSGSLASIKQRYTPPCAVGSAPLRLSFGVKPGGSEPRFNLAPRRMDRQQAWPASTKAAVAPAPAPEPGPGPKTSTPSINWESLAEAYAKVLEGYKQDDIRKIAGGCRNSILVMAFAFSKQGPAVACQCLGRDIVRGESATTVNALVADIDAGRDFDDAHGRIPSVRMEGYLESCLTPAS